MRPLSCLHSGPVVFLPDGSDKVYSADFDNILLSHRKTWKSQISGCIISNKPDIVFVIRNETWLKKIARNDKTTRLDRSAETSIWFENLIIIPSIPVIDCTAVGIRSKTIGIKYKYGKHGGGVTNSLSALCKLEF